MSTADEKFKLRADATAIILVSPRHPGNMGAAARAMANFGFSQLRLVSPIGSHTSEEAFSMAVDAAHILRGAQLFDTLEQAIADRTHVFATTRRTGKRRRAQLTPPDMARIIKTLNPAKGAAIVFGPEDKGLDNESLALCNAVVSLRTHAEYNSLNLAQAVLLMLYEIHREFMEESPEAPSMNERVDALADAAESLLRDAGFITGRDSAQVALRLRKIALRARPAATDARLLHAAMLHVRDIIAK